MKKLFFALCFALSSLIATAQTYFQSGFGDTIKDKGTSIIGTMARRYVITGTSGQNTMDSADIVVYLIDSLGGLLNSARIGAPGDEFTNGVVQTPDGGYIVVGTTYASTMDTAHTDIFALKIGPLVANVVWFKVYGGPNDEEAHSIFKTPEDNFVIVGSTKSYGTATQSAMAIKINDTGDQQWGSVCSAGLENFFNHGDVSADQNYLLAGGCKDHNDFDNYVVKLDSNGNFIWSKRFKSVGDGTEWINGIKRTSDDGFVSSGISTINTAGDTDQCIIKYDATGTITWAYNYGTPNFDVSLSIVETNVNHYVVSGYSTISSPGSIINQMVFEELDETGNMLWTHTLGDSLQWSEGSDVIRGNDGGYAIVGSSVAFSDPNGDVFVVKTDTNASSGCYEFPIVLGKNFFDYTVDSSASIVSSILLNESPDTINIRQYYDQYSQNCFFDGINSIAKDNYLKIFPNPAENELQLQTLIQASALTIYDQLGRSVLHKKVSTNDAIIDVSSLKPGIYFVEVQCESNLIRSKFVRN